MVEIIKPCGKSGTVEHAKFWVPCSDVIVLRRVIKEVFKNEVGGKKLWQN